MDFYKFILFHTVLTPSPPEYLIHHRKNKSGSKFANKKAKKRLEKEMAQVHFDTQKIKETYGSNSLKLTIITSHIKKILDNPKVFHWLLRNKSDYLIELTDISDINKLT